MNSKSIDLTTEAVHRFIDHARLDQILIESGHFSGWPRAVLRALIAASKLMFYGSGGKVVDETQDSNDFIYVVNGRIQLTAADARETWHLQRTYCAGDLHRPFKDNGWNSSLWASDECTLLYMPRRHLLNALKQFPRLARATLIGDPGKSPFVENFQLPTTQFSSICQLISHQLIQWIASIKSDSQSSVELQFSVRELASIFGMDSLELRIVLSLLEQDETILGDLMTITVPQMERLNSIALGAVR